MAMDTEFGKPGSRDWIEENRRRAAAGEPPLVAPTAQYRVMKAAYVGGRMAEAGEIVVLPVHEVRAEDWHLEPVSPKPAPWKPAPAKSAEVEAPPVKPAPVPPVKPVVIPPTIKE